jgi:hypothetical protein
MAITIKEVAFAGNLSLQLGGIRLRLALTPYPIAQNSYALQFNFNHVARVQRRSFTVGARSPGSRVTWLLMWLT